MTAGKSRIIGLIVSRSDNQFYPEAVKGLSNALQDEDCRVLVFTVPQSQTGVGQIIQDMMGYQVDGIVAASVTLSSELTQTCAAAGIPVVLFNRGQPGSDLSLIKSDNLQGAKRATKALIDAGHTRIAHIAGWETSAMGRERRQGFEAAMEDAGLTPIAIVDAMFNRYSAQEAAVQMMHLIPCPDAIFVGSDDMAFAVLDVIRAEGFRVPEDVSIIGYDDVPLADWDAYDLTTVRQPINRMVEATVNTLLAQINGAAGHGEIIEIAGKLIQRGSSQLPRTEAAPVP